jgi:murein DD-endopeptidase MepM/ murein hydrolase activator NlpD
MLLYVRWVLWALLLVACSPSVDSQEGRDGADKANFGGGMPKLTLPFPGGEHWIVTQTWGPGSFGSHVDYGFPYGDDSYALDFAQNGCEVYGKPVHPMADGTVMEVTYDGFGDHGYGNSVLVNHGGGYGQSG